MYIYSYLFFCTSVRTSATKLNSIAVSSIKVYYSPTNAQVIVLKIVLKVTLK